MVDMPSSDKELKYHNVSIHSQGKTEHGTLYLLQHHACFSYYPSAQKGKGGAHSRHASASSTSAATNDSTEPRSETSKTTAQDPATAPESAKAVENEDCTAQADSKLRQKVPKVRAKEIWIPYPMIGHCMLRPSHAASIVTRQSNAVQTAPTLQNGDALFPPTFGTSEYGRSSMESARLAPLSTPPRPSSPVQDQQQHIASASARQPVIRIRRKDFQMMALHFNSGESGISTDETARQVFYVLRKHCCVEKIEALHAFHYKPHKDEIQESIAYDARREYARMGISPKAADGPGTAWRISDINQDYSYSQTYPSLLCVPKAVSDNMLKYGGSFRSKARIPSLSYLHSNGGSITRASQPLVGLQSKRNPQDERLVSAIFSSHTPTSHSPEDSPPQLPTLTTESSAAVEDSSVSRLPGLSDGGRSLPTSRSETALDETVSEKPAPRRVYGSTRQNVIADARPKVNAVLNRGTGGGWEDVANYTGNQHTPVEIVFLNIANIHIMRKSLDKVIESFGSADYVNMKPNQDTLRKSGWLGHIAGLLDGSEMVARVVGLGGSHVLVHCSDGWDRTSQVAALAQIMLDPHYRTLNGFISLVQKDFLSFGHKFRDRDGIEGSENWFEVENERIAPSRNRENNNSDPSGLNTMGQKALSGAKKWLEKNRGNFFNQQSSARDSGSERSSSRPSSPPPNPLIHSPPTPSSKEEKKHEMKEGEVSPVFHQFLDAVYQLLYHYPNTFEFNERFLKRLFYQAYACQYGEFLFNNERTRSQHKLPSVWGHFLSRRQEFTVQDFVPKTDDPLLFPRRSGVDREVDVRWWADLFGRKDEDMNLPRAIAPAVNTAPLRPSVSFDAAATEQGETTGTTTSHGAIKETKSTPRLANMRDSLTNSFSSMGFGGGEARKESAPEVGSSSSADIAPTTSGITDQKSAQDDAQQPVVEVQTPPKETEAPKFDQLDMEQGDPLGVSTSAPKQVGSGGLDFAAFASQNAFRER